MIDLQKFYDPNSLRHLFSVPFCYRDRVGACNGHILLLEPGKSDDNFNSLDDHILSALIDDLLESDFDHPDLPIMPEKSTCQTCRGRGTATIKTCPECDGIGEIFFGSLQYESECSSCLGYGEVALPGKGGICPKCLGDGLIHSSFSTVEIDGITVAANYAELIVHEPDLLVCGRPDHKALFFKCGLQIGIIMEMEISKTNFHEPIPDIISDLGAINCD